MSRWTTTIAAALSLQLGAASPIAAQTQRDQDALGQGPLTRARLRTFEDFSDLTIADLLETEKLRFGLNTFGNLTFDVVGGEDRDTEAAFRLGQVGLLLTAELEGSIRSLTEVVVETTPEEGTIVDLERLWMEYRGDGWFLRAGRMHTSFGFWNAAYHHGAWMQTSIARPRILAFEDEGGVLPVHAIGLMGGASIDAGTGNVQVRATVANGRGSEPDDIRVADDTNDAKSIALSVYWQSGGELDLRIGIGALYDRIEGEPAEVRPALPDEDLDEYVGNAHVVWFGEPVSFVSEVFAIRHEAEADSWDTVGAFGLLSYRTGRYEPYVRLEGITVSGGADPFFVPDPGDPGEAIVGDLVEAIAGVRIETSTWSALKLEYRFVDRSDEGTSEHAGVVDWAFGI